MNEDPLGLEAGDVNLYRYVRNNPVNKVDPSALFFVDLFEGASNLVEAGVQTAQRGARAVASTAWRLLLMTIRAWSCAMRRSERAFARRLAEKSSSQFSNLGRLEA